MKRKIMILAAAASVAVITHGRAAETWRATELAFEAGADYDKTGADAVAFDAVFTHASGEKVSRPGFWDGGKTFRVRFAPTKPGSWSWSTTCRGDAALDGKTGALEAKPYAGSLEIYKRGFVKTAKGAKHFTYADGTPFFYLGDTHWGLYKEEIDEPGPHAGATGAASHFKYIVDRRAAQGFTVLQSEPIGASTSSTGARRRASPSSSPSPSARSSTSRTARWTHPTSPASVSPTATTSTSPRRGSSTRTPNSSSRPR